MQNRDLAKKVAKITVMGEIFNKQGYKILEWIWGKPPTAHISLMVNNFVNNGANNTTSQCSSIPQVTLSI